MLSSHVTAPYKLSHYYYYYYDSAYVYGSGQQVQLEEDGGGRSGL